MTLEEILNLAREAGLSAPQEVMVNDVWMAEDVDLMRFAALIAAAENEACAEVAEQTVCDLHLPTGVQIYGGRAAKAIRARREKR